MKKCPKIALGAWSWDSGAAGGDQEFDNHLDREKLQPVLGASQSVTTIKGVVSQRLQP